MIISSYGNQNLKDKKIIDKLEKEFAKEIEKRMAKTSAIRAKGKKSTPF